MVKNNLGPCDVPTLAFRVVGHRVTGDVWTGKVEWLGESTSSIREAVVDVASTGDRTATAEAADWLLDYLTAAGGTADSAAVKRAGPSAPDTRPMP